MIALAATAGAVCYAAISGDPTVEQSVKTQQQRSSPAPARTAPRVSSDVQVCQNFYSSVDDLSYMGYESDQIVYALVDQGLTLETITQLSDKCPAILGLK